MIEVILFDTDNIPTITVDYFVNKVGATLKISHEHGDYYILPEYEKDALKHKLSGNDEEFFKCVFDDFYIMSFVAERRFDINFIEDIKKFINESNCEVGMRVENVEIEKGDLFRINSDAYGYESFIKFDKSRWIEF